MATELVEFKNKKASHEYHFIDNFTAGLVLTGTEIKSIRAGKVSFVDPFCLFINRELWAKGLHISEYKYGSYYNHEAKRDRKLLMNRRELRKLEMKVNEGGLTIIPTRLFIANNGMAKLNVALCKGKKIYDKREDIKQRDIKREMERDGY